LAERFHQTFKRKYQQTQGGRAYNGSVTDRYLLTLKETTARRAVYVELGNIQNDWDQQRIVLKNNRQALANWMCQALLNE
ncbi:MAG: N-acetylmuramoyl-L-alanine amidase, partial [Saprospiraceae bacterium]|nr:N-acetylmuramoyl-L-alanine amidase [Saprospiraceae bacterium]